MKLRPRDWPALVLLAMAAGCALAAAQEAPPEEDQPGKTAPAATEEPPVMSAGMIEQTSPGEYVLTGDVEFRYGKAHLLADSARYSESTRMVVAEGNVVLQYGNSQISGDRVEMNLDTEYASIENARAYVEPDVIVDAERLERIGEETYRITRGKLTTCTQPTPFWSFYVGSAIVRLGGYARMTNAAFKLGKVPSLWTPYLLWPVKEERSTGLLIPQFGFSGKRGAFLSNALFVPMGRSMDATFQFDFFNGAVDEPVIEHRPQRGYGLEFRYVPNESGSGILTSYYLNEKFRSPLDTPVQERDRYHATLAHTQRFGSGFTLLADINTVSDFDYFQDFEREIGATTSPTVFSQIDLSRLSGSYALNVRFSRQLQFLSVTEENPAIAPTTVDDLVRLNPDVDPNLLVTEDLTLWRLPEIELRGRGIRLWNSPLYLNFESSFGGLARRTRTVDLVELGTCSPNLDPDPALGRCVTGLVGNQCRAGVDSDCDKNSLRSDQATYTRADLFPTISGNFAPVPWLDISPTVSVRRTLYSAGLEEGQGLDPNAPPELFPTGPSFMRRELRMGVKLVGPRFFRIFGQEDSGKTRYKHTFEPSVSYDYVPESKRPERIIPFDEIDATLPVSNLLRYALTSRLFAKRPEEENESGPVEVPALSGSFASLVHGEEPPSRHEQLVATVTPEEARIRRGEEEATAPPEPGAGDSETDEGEARTERPETTEPAPTLDQAASDTYVPTDISTGRGRQEIDPNQGLLDLGAKPGIGPVEVATFELSQAYTFNRSSPLSATKELELDGETPVIESQFSPVLATLRFNPSRAASLDFQTTYDILFDDISRVSLSGNLQTSSLAYARFSWVFDRDLEGSLLPPRAVPSECPDGSSPVDGRCFNDRSQVRFQGGVAMLGRRITLDVEGSYDIEESFLRDQRYRMGYNTQCCSVLVELARRSFISTTIGETDETEYRFVLNLRGVGTFLDMNGRVQ